MNDNTYKIIKYLFGISLMLILAITRLNGNNVNRDLAMHPNAIKAGTVDSFSTNKNYVIERIYTEASASNSNAKFVENVIYQDGFGRKMQEIQVLGSPGGNADIVVPHVYGIHGKEEEKYLPYPRTGNAGIYDVNSMKSTNWDIYGSPEAAYAFSKVIYDDSPLNRVVKIIGPGKAWHSLNKGSETTYETNTSGEVLLFRVNEDGTLTHNNKTYDAGSLQKKITVDEDSCRVEEFMDRNGRKILSVGIENGNRLETYCVYDKRGLIRYVLSPEASVNLKNSITQTTLQQYAYYYEYDASERLILKRLPGCDPVYMLYDKRNRVVMSQDGKQRAENNNKWSYCLYDNQNRVVENGEVILTQETVFSKLQTLTSTSDNYIPTGTRTALQFTLYDNYNPMPHANAHPFKAVPNYPDAYNPRVIDKVTSVSSRILGTEKWLTTTIYYDSKGQVIQTISNNPQGGISRINKKYDFTGNVVRQQECHQIKDNQTDILETVDDYDIRGRLTSSTTTLNGGIPATTLYTYDAIGRLVSQKLGTVTETMTYNSRGWLTSKTSLPFKIKLRYESPEGNSKACYNGNISEWEWQHGTDTTFMYGFKYDKLNRLKETSQKWKNISSWTDYSKHYLEKDITYDHNGNIKTLQRSSRGQLADNLVYAYTGNQLNELTEDNQTTSSNDIYLPCSVLKGTYSYDKNGNMITDSRRTLKFTYNLLNLLNDVKTVSGTLKAKYNYLADGTKLQVRDNGEVNGFDYLGSLTYRKSNAGLELESASFRNGVIRANASNSGGIEVNYLLTDHLGSVRAIVNGSGTVQERNDYYPFGARHTRSVYAQQINNRYKYNGKEEQVTGDLNYLDYGARMYDSKLGRWFTIDPLLEKAINISPYAYCVNNPMKYIDPNGERINFYQQSNKGKWTRVEFINAFDATTRYLWEMFARTQAGFDFLSLYAEAGQSIGSVVFYEDGPFAGIDLNIYGFDDMEGVLGSFSVDLGKRKDNISFTIKMNRIDIYDKNELADYLVALGHEFFIHMKQWQRKYLSAFAKKDSKGLDHLVEISSKEGGIYDHTRYINGNESYKSFTTYLQQLKSIKDSPLNPTLIDNAKKKHDEYYEKYRKVDK